MKYFTLAALTVVWLTSCTQTSKPVPDSVSETESILVMEEFPRKVEFPSLDSLPITAYLYHVSDSLPVIILCHQARYNKFEYAGIAEKLNDLGFNCIAIDQRSGGPIANKVNETTLAALEAGKPIDFLDAEQDMIAAINYGKGKYDEPVILWGSSYSSTLALYLATENEDVKAVVSFSPGNYLTEDKGSLIEKLAGLEKPMFVTSSKREAAAVTELLSAMTLGENQIQFIPEGDGHHGSRALWTNQSDGEEYWAAIQSFLKKL